MRSKTSKKQSNRPSPWKAARACSESELVTLATELATHLRPGARVLLEGVMGAGKSTFARALLHALGVHQPPEGSPTFAIAHEYTSRRGEVVHIDFYRLKSEAEIQEAGIDAYFWERPAIVIAEWSSLWPGYADEIAAPSSQNDVWFVDLSFAGDRTDRRDVIVQKG